MESQSFRISQFLNNMLYHLSTILTYGTVEHFAIFEALRNTNIHETFINILQNIYSQATARIHLDKIVPDDFPINRGVSLGDPLLQLWRKSLGRQTSLKESMSMEKTLLT